MKRIIKYACVVGILFIVVFTIINFTNPILGKFLVGSARIVGEETKSKIFIDGKRNLNAKLFTVKSNFGTNEPRDYLVLYLRDLNDYDGFPVLIIDKEFKDVSYPNASEKDYNIVFGKLFQSESGANVMVSLSNELKGLGFNPKLNIGERSITFKIPINNEIQEITINIA